MNAFSYQEEKLMIFKNKNHYLRFCEAIETIGWDDQAACAVCYLLSCKKKLWSRVKRGIKADCIDFEEMNFDPRNDTEQALFDAAFDLYYGINEIPIGVLFEYNMIPDEAFFALLYAITYLRYGFGFDTEAPSEMVPSPNKLGGA